MYVNQGFIYECEKEYKRKATEAAKKIAANMSYCPIALIAGPSGSGKTTTARVIENILCSKGFSAYTLSMDNYFRSLTNSEKLAAKEGGLCLESPSRLNIPLLNEHIEKMVNCAPVELPVYNFALSKQLPSGITLKRKPGEIIIFEGIHALNPLVITADFKEAEKLFVSVGAKSENNPLLLHPGKIRLLRRILRDRLFRGRTLMQTVERFFQVEQGEEKFITPYKRFSDLQIDTFIPYELSVYKSLLWEELVAFKENKILSDIAEALERISPVPLDMVPQASLIREFTG